jgi:hypothetical protein
MSAFFVVILTAVMILLADVGVASSSHDRCSNPVAATILDIYFKISDLILHRNYEDCRQYANELRNPLTAVGFL